MSAGNPLESVTITADDEWEKQLTLSGLRVVDVYAKWAGPCEAMVALFKRLKLECAELLTISFAQTDYIEALKNFRDKSCPTFFIFYNDVLVKIIRGANATLIEKSVKEQLEIEKTGGVHEAVLLEAGFDIVEPEPERRSVASRLPEDTSSKPDLVQKSKSKTDINVHTAGPNDTETFALIKPDAMKSAVIEAIMEQIRSSRFHSTKMKKVWMTPENVNELYKEHVDKPFFSALVTYFTSGPCLAMVLSKENAVQDWRDLIGPVNSVVAKETVPKSLRALFGTDNRINAVFGSDSQASADREIQMFFGPESKISTLEIHDDEMSIKNSPGIQKTLCVIKSEDAEVRQAIIERIICRGIEIFKRDEVRLDVSETEELFPEIANQKEQLDFLTRAPILALVLKGENVVKMLVEMAGHEDPEIARTVSPQSLRALYGKTKINNAVHVSLSADKAVFEVNQLFPHALDRSGSVVLRDSKVGTSTNPHPANYKQSKEEIHAMLERTCALIKPDAYASGKKDLIVDIIITEGFTIIKQAEVQLSLGQAQEFYKEHQTKPFYNELISWMSGTPIYAMVLERENAVSAWRELAGPTNSVMAKEIAPKSIRALYGTDGSQNAVHGSDAPISAEKEIPIIFGNSVSPFPEPLPGQKPPMTNSRSIKAIAKSAENASGSSSMAKSSSTKLGATKTTVATKNATTLKPKVSGSKSALSTSKTNLSASKTGLSNSKSALSGSKSALSGSKSALSSSKSALAAAKKPTSKADLSKSESKPKIA